MKKIILSALIAGVLGTSVSAAVIPKGTWKISGDSNALLSFINQETRVSGTKSDINIKQLNIGGEINYFFERNFSAGIEINYNNSKTDIKGNGNYDEISYSIAPILKYNISLSNRLSFVPGIKAGIYNYQYDDNIVSSIDNGTILGVEGKLNYFFNDYISVDFGLEYNNIDVGNSNNGYKRSRIDTVVGFSVYF